MGQEMASIRKTIQEPSCGTKVGNNKKRKERGSQSLYPELTITVPFCGRWAFLFQFLKQFSKLEFEKSKTHLLFYDNSADEDFGKIIQGYLHNNKNRFKTVRYVRDSSLPVAGKGIYKTTMVARVMSNIKKLIKTEYWFNLEDDTTCPPDAIKRLFKIIQMPNVAAAQGCELSRWDKLTAGVSRIVETRNYPPTEDEVSLGLQSSVKFGDYIPVKSSGVERIGGGGLYCILFRMKDIKKLRFVPKISDLGGCDICHGYQINASGKYFMIDWSIRCTHWAVNSDDSKSVEIRC